MIRVVKSLFWLWLIILIVINVIPLGNDVKSGMSGTKLWNFRLDYLLHLAMILVFAWIWLLGKLMDIMWFSNMETLKYSAVIVLCAIGLELLQFLLPWRTFNPMDMIFNLTGAMLGIIVVIVSSRLARTQK